MNQIQFTWFKMWKKSSETTNLFFCLYPQFFRLLQVVGDLPTWFFLSPGFKFFGANFCEGRSNLYTFFIFGLIHAKEKMLIQKLFEPIVNLLLELIGRALIYLAPFTHSVFSLCSRGDKRTPCGKLAFPKQGAAACAVEFQDTRTCQSSNFQFELGLIWMPLRTEVRDDLNIQGTN